jgi:hypothetical protein
MRGRLLRIGSLLLLLVCLQSVSSKFPHALRRTQTVDRVDEHAPVSVPLLVLIFTQQANIERRRWQRRTWLSQQWTRGEVVAPAGAPSTATPSAAAAAAPPPVAWRYVYVQAVGERRPPDDKLDVVRGDVVVLSAVREGYANLVYKTLEALRWALRHVAFGALLKTDDDTIVHVGRVASWLHHRVPTAARVALYAGRVFNDSQIIRANYTKAHLLHPEWYPDDFVKWAVPYASYAGGAHGGLYFPPYCSGGGYLLGPAAAARIVAAHDARAAAGRPIVRVEDAFVGILAEESGVRPTDITDYVQDPPAGRKQDAALFGGRMLVHRVVNPERAFEWITFPVVMDYERPAGAWRATRRVGRLIKASKRTRATQPRGASAAASGGGRTGGRAAPTGRRSRRTT